MPKFDVIVGNPPYLGRLHLSFLSNAIDISEKYVVFVEPAYWVVNQKPVKRSNIERELFEKLEGKKMRIDLINLSYEFENIKTAGYGLIIFIDKKNDGDIEVWNRVKNINYTTNRLEDVDQYGNHPDIIELKQKILGYPEKVLDFNNLKGGKYFVNIPLIRGGYSKNPNEIMNSSSISFLPKGAKIENKSSSLLSYGFSTVNEAQNFIDYLKTKFSRFALSLYKLNLNLHSKELLSVPWLDFKEKWDDKKLYKKFNLNKNQIEFIEKNIPNYY